jgi:membrane protein implicated in regulation of membrane protease activity
MFLLLGIVLLIVLPSPWGWVALAVCLVVGVGELLFWRGRVSGLRVRTGADTLIGQEARVIHACRPMGQVTVEGEIWTVRCDAGADAGELVTVVGRDRLVLRVEPKRSAE